MYNKILFVRISLLIIIAILFANNSYSQVSVQCLILNQRIAGDSLKADVYLKNTSSTPQRLSGYTLYFPINSSIVTTSVTTQFTNQVPQISVITTTINNSLGISPRVIGFGSPNFNALPILSTTGNGTFLGTLSIQNVGNFYGYSGLQFGTTAGRLSEVILREEQTNQDFEPQVQYIQPPQFDVGPRFDIIVTNQSVSNQKYQFTLAIKPTSGQTFSLGSSSIQLNINPARFSSPSITTLSLGSAKLSNNYIVQPSITNGLISIGITSPQTTTASDYNAKIEQIQTNATVSIGTFEVNGLTSTSSILSLQTAWNTTGTVIGLRRNVSPWSMSYNISSNASYVITLPDFVLQSTSLTSNQSVCTDTQFPLLWTSQNIPFVKIDLLQNFQTVTTITVTNATNGLNSLLWQIPQTLASSSVYSVRFSDFSAPSFSFSPIGLLQITRPPVITQHPQSISLCVTTSSVQFTVGVQSFSTSAIQWQSSTNNSQWTQLSGETNSTLQLISTSGSQFIRARVSNSCGIVFSNSALYEVKNLPIVRLSQNNIRICQNSTTTITSSVTANPIPILQWQKFEVSTNTWTNISGATTSSLQINAQSTSSGGRFRLFSTNECGSTSEECNVEVSTIPMVQLQSSQQNLCTGSTLQLLSSISGNPYPQIFWERSTNGSLWSTVLSSSTNATIFERQNVSKADAGLYRIRVENSCGIVFSNSIQVNIFEQVVLLQQPRSVEVCAGETAQFESRMSGDNVSLQWEVSTNSGLTWNAISSATSENLQIVAVNSQLSGNRYRLRYSNYCTPDMYSQFVQLIINSKPSITRVIQPEYVICSGGTLSLATDAIGSPQPQIQWQVSLTNGAEWQNVQNGIEAGTLISGAESTTLTLSGITLQQGGRRYRATFTNSCGSTTSISSLITTNFAPIVLSQPQTTITCEGDLVRFLISENSNPKSQIQWQVRNPQGGDWTNVQGSTNSVFEIVASVTTAQLEYRAQIQNNCGIIYSNIVHYKLLTKPVIVTAPASKEVCKNSSIQLQAEYLGTEPMTGQWQKSVNSGLTWTNLVGSTSQVLEINNLTVINDGEMYRISVSNFCGSTTSTPARIKVFDAPKISSQPQSRTITLGDSVIFAASLSTSNTPQDIQLQWYRSGLQLQDNQRITGSTSNTLTIRNTLRTDENAEYRLVIKNSCGADTSIYASLTFLIPEISITKQPIDFELCSGGVAKFSVNANSSVTTATLQFQWRKGNEILQESPKYVGTNTSTLEIRNVTTFDNASNYNCVISIQNQTIQAITNNARLAVQTLPVVVKNTGTLNACRGENVIFELQVLGSEPLTYTWFYKGELLQNQNSPFLKINNVSDSNAGEYYCRISNNCGSIQTQPMQLDVKLQPRISIRQNVINLSLGDTLTLNAEIQNPGSSISMQWYKNGNIIPNATQDQYISFPVTPSDEGIYYCELRYECGKLISDTVSVKVIVASITEEQQDSFVNIQGTKLIIGTDYQNQSQNLQQIVIYVSDALGQVVFQKRIEKSSFEEIDLSHLPSGAYFCKVILDQKVISRAFLIIH